jgi:hypothetical protein
MTLPRVYRAKHTIPDRNNEERLHGRALLATLPAILFDIRDSSIVIIPILCWSVA